MMASLFSCVCKSGLNLFQLRVFDICIVHIILLNNTCIVQGSSAGKISLAGSQSGERRRREGQEQKQGTFSSGEKIPFFSDAKLNEKLLNDHVVYSYRLASEADLGLVDLLLLLEEEELGLDGAVGVAPCEVGAGWLDSAFSLFLSGCGVITNRQYMKCMKSEGCLCHDYQQVHMTTQSSKY